MPFSEPFAMVIERKPLSLAAENKRKRWYQDEIRTIASNAAPNRPPLSGDLYVKIVWFHGVKVTTDLDNIAKGILDAMKGVVYEDDLAVVRCELERIDTREDYTFAERHAPVTAFNVLLELLSRNPASVLYVEAGPAGRRVVSLGPREDD